jgi:flavin-dependent dehydrogenase
MSDLENAVSQYDVTILGGGLAGLTLALQLKKAHAESRILVVEKLQHPVAEAAHKVGESTVEIAAKYLLDLGLEEHLVTHQLRKFGLRFFFSTEDNLDITRRTEIGLAKPTFLPSFQLDRGRLENMLGQEVQRQGITFVDTCKVMQVSLQPDASHSVRLSQGKKEFDVSSRWVVDASGRSSLLKRQLGLAKEVGHNVNAVWFRIGRKIAVDEWSNNPEWQARVTEGERYLSTVHLCGEGYWVWLIPLASGSTSVGIVTDPTYHPFDTLNRFGRAMEWLRAHEPQCANNIEGYLENVQDFRVMKDYSYSCQQVYSGDRWCLTGEAGVFLDPLYSPGSDFIAMSNDLITDLICRDLTGEDIRERTRGYNLIFLSIANASLKVYERQYGLLGNTQVMVAKYIWDSVTYWGNFSQLFFHDKIRTLASNRKLILSLHRSSQVDTRIQAFFREWAAIDRPIILDGFVDHYNPLDFMKKFHASLEASFTDTEFDAEFANNIHLIERIAGLMVSKVIEAYTDFSDDEAVLKQVQIWKDDALLTEFVTLYQKEAQSSPINGDWVYLAPKKVQPELSMAFHQSA